MTERMSTGDLEMDSEVEFRRTLKTVGENLVSRDVLALKFLCQDLIPSARLEKINRGLDLLSELERKHKIESTNNVFLAELLLHIGRLDLIRKLGIEPRAFKATIRKLGPQLNSFRLLLQEWVDDLTSSEVEEMRFLAAAHLSRRTELEEAETVQELFTVLEKNQVITPQDVSVLLEIGTALDRNELLQKVMRYQAGLPPLPTPTPTYSQASPLLGNAANPLLRGGRPLSGEGSGQSVPTKIHLDSRYEYTPPDDNNLPNNNDPVARPTNLPVVPPSPYQPAPAYPPGEPINRTDDLPCYKMDAKPRGLCLIINNRDFFHIPNDNSSRRMPAREGTEVDRNNLEYIFKKLQFDVRIHNNLTEMQMLQLLRETAVDVDHSGYDCFTCCILTHGIQGHLYGVNGRLVEIKDLTNFYKASTCRTLKGKPKLFFIQACQGKMKQIGVDLQKDGPSAPEEHGMDLNVETLPNEADFLMGYATLPGFVSYRSKTQGSWYITTLVQMLDRYGDKYDLLSIMIKVNEEVSKATAQMKDASLYKQSPAPVPTLRKKIYFY